MKLAVTGATGFVGSHLLDRALAAGHEVRALTRREQPAREGVTWIRGALDDHASLAELCAGADAVIRACAPTSTLAIAAAACSPASPHGAARRKCSRIRFSPARARSAGIDNVRRCQPSESAR